MLLGGLGSTHRMRCHAYVPTCCHAAMPLGCAVNARALAMPLRIGHRYAVNQAKQRSHHTPYSQAQGHPPYAPMDPGPCRAHRGGFPLRVTNWDLELLCLTHNLDKMSKDWE